MDFALLKLPRKVEVVPVDKVKVEPLDEGRINFVAELIFSSEFGDNEKPSVYLRLKSASSAPIVLAYSVADSSFQR